MKPTVRAVPALILFLVLFPVSLYAISVFDVIRLTQEKYSDQEIIKVIRVTDSRFVLTADDTARLKKEGVTESVIREMLSRPAREKGAAAPAPSASKPARASTTAKSSPKDVPAADARTLPHDPASILNEIVRLTKAGLSDDTVLAYAKAHRAELPSVMPADRLAWLRESGVSQSVVLYLTAIDVRASNDGSVESANYASDEGETYPVPAYSAPDVAYENGYDDGGTYAVYPEPSYPVSDYASYYDYPYFGGGYYYPYYPYYYPAWFFVDTSFHHHGHDHDGHGHDGHGHGGHDGDGHHHGHMGSPGDHNPGHGGGVAASQSWRDRPTLARGSFTQASRQPRSNVVSRGNMSRASRGFGGPGVVSRPGFSGGRGYPGSTVGRAPISRPGGSAAFSRPSFSGGGSSGRAPIARAGGGGMGHGGGGGRGR